MEFGDSSNWHAIPAGWSAVLPVDGEFAAPVAALSRFSRVRWYTVAGDYPAAGAVDWEPGNPCYSPAGLRRFVRGRAANQQRARVYVDRADAAEAVEALRAGPGNLISYPGLLWWIATLDGEKRTAEQLADELASLWAAPIPAAQLWAQQYATLTASGPALGLTRPERIAAAAAGAFDVSELFGEW